MASTWVEADGWGRACLSWWPGEPGSQSRGPALHPRPMLHPHSAVRTRQDREPMWMLDEGGSHDPRQTPCPFRTDGSLLWLQGVTAVASHPDALEGCSEHSYRYLEGAHQGEQGPGTKGNWPGPCAAKIKSFLACLPAPRSNQSSMALSRLPKQEPRGG